MKYPADTETQQLHRRLQHLADERLRALEALEMAGCVGAFDCSLNKLSSHLPILEETAFKCHTLAPCAAMCFCLIDESDNDIVIDYCTPEDMRQAFAKEVDALIEDGDFAWALERNRPHVLRCRTVEGDLLLHTLATPSRIRGMFVAFLASPRNTIGDVTLSLLGVVMNSCAHMLESYTLYSMLRADTGELERRLRNSRQAQEHLDLRRQRLERQVLKLEAALHEARASRQDTAAETPDPVSDLAGQLLEQSPPEVAARLILQICRQHTRSADSLLAGYGPRPGTLRQLCGSEELYRLCGSEQLWQALDLATEQNDILTEATAAKTGYLRSGRHGRHCLYVPLQGAAGQFESVEPLASRSRWGFLLFTRPASRYTMNEIRLVQRMARLLEPAFALLARDEAA